MDKATVDKAIAAARWLLVAHEKKEPFRPLPDMLAPRDLEEAYLTQDEFVALRAQKLGGIAGYKIALATPAMQKFVGVDAPQGGVLLESTLHRSPARVRAADYVRLIVEFEIAVEMIDDLSAADAPFTRESVRRCVGSIIPAIEIADDRGADYAELAKHPLDLIADNGWSEGAVLGAPAGDWKRIDLAAVRGVAYINGKAVGEGRGADAMGHPLDAVAWVANHLAGLGRGLLRREIVITGSLVTTKKVKSGDAVKFSLEGLGDVELQVD
jgi:2-keto-4-pentenoate hydratase